MTYMTRRAGNDIDEQKPTPQQQQQQQQ